MKTKARNFFVVATSILLVVIISPCLAMAMIDLNANPTPVVSSGSFICKTWGGTIMDAFSVGGGNLMVSYCPYCGQSVNGDQQFCQHCGKPIKSETAQ